ncbi:hypothetical protein PHLGIDRAFT_30805 [Phlebiopsis gigantea 11061_1 CR5-6]|uniref:GPI ethanolamine phosphate transferase 1 n=1 Tax=Phlebiopsis gigantea (strain 11061_1 CR5-6) TaxID=745531 RepID=A0A0C3RW49_PHLG1|nr:hypothetical protein PHLGIDRAFT_30805 [Phlebiopsis gigantea 11061_1 CR5-6]
MSRSLSPRALTESIEITKLLLVGLVFHLVYIGTVFDCYFTSPVVHGMQQFRIDTPGAKRLVLIVGDGLRADLLMNLNAFPNIPDSPEVVAPFLRSVAETRGAIGISHTRVPTESRPGHVALIGGMYEDVSAVTRGWKTNPVHFDSVFNQSSHTFSFGSPDILPMFAQGATPGKVDMWCYHEDEEDFTKDATALDIWVLDQLRALFHNATDNSTLTAQLRQDKTVFFLHLLGLDTTGHSYRPHSKEYMTNIQVVDTIVRQTESLLSEFYGDEETAYVFTADHGMSVIGNHGDGDPDNTRTPLIAWGAGVRGPLPDSVPSSHDDYSMPWGLTHLFRHDVEQADVAALMSALIGVDWPVNSVGVLPDVDHTRPGYLKFTGSAKDQAEAALVNAKVILEHYRVKHELKKSTAFLYKPYSYFAELEDEGEPGSSVLNVVEVLIKRGRHDEAREASANLIASALAGLRYLETYDRSLIRIMVFVAYTGWMAFSAAHILPAAWVQPISDEQMLDIFSATCLLVSWTLFAMQHKPWSLYLYVTFPVYFWREAVLKCGGSLGFFLLFASLLVAVSSAKSLRAKLGLPLVNQVAGWAILSLASALPFVVAPFKLDPNMRIWALFLGFAVCFVLLSISVEGCFYVVYSATLYMWTEVETALTTTPSGRPLNKNHLDDKGYQLRAEDVRIAVFFLFFVQVAFFGTGNVASISSFYLEPVYRLVPIFNPFLMATLLIFKIVAPYVMLSVLFADLNHRLGLPPLSLFTVAVTLTDVMTITFFFNVSDTGSWLEIGQTISFFCISSLLLVWSAGICVLGEALLRPSRAAPPKAKSG